jgi:peptidoglycan/LPS O-acetylase OafA/YrhL
MQATAETRRPGTWLPCADGLRATAAVLVFFQHSAFLTGVMFNSDAGSLLARFDVAPPIFFALSGFLLARPYVASVLDGTPLPDTRSYYVRRVLRIVPAYWVALTLTYVWLRPDAATKASGFDYVLHYLFLQIYPSDSFPKGISAAWTLAVEVSFYLALPMLAAVAAWAVRNRRGPSQKAVVLLLGLAVLVVLSLLWRGAVYAVDGALQPALWLPGTFCHFGVGIGAAVLALWADRREVARPVTEAIGRHDLLWWTIAALLVVFSSSQLGLAKGLEHASWNRELLGELVRVLAAGFLLLPVAFGPQDRGVIRWVLRSWPIASLGVISYGFFLFHVPLIETFIELTGREVFLDWSDPGTHIFSDDVLHPILLAFGASVVAGTLSWFLLEKPIIGRHRSRAKRQAAREPVGDLPVIEQAAP